MIPQDEHRDRAAFDRVLIALAEYVPQHAVLGPGLVAFGARGLERFYGSEEAASRMLVDALVGNEPLAEGRIGIADDVFTAVTAAQSTSARYPLRRVEPGEQQLFLSRCLSTFWVMPETVSLLQRLGLSTLGDFAGLGLDAIREATGVFRASVYFIWLPVIQVLPSLFAMRLWTLVNVWNCQRSCTLVEQCGVSD